MCIYIYIAYAVRRLEAVVDAAAQHAEELRREDLIISIS